MSGLSTYLMPTGGETMNLQKRSEKSENLTSALTRTGFYAALQSQPVMPSVRFPEAFHVI